MDLSNGTRIFELFFVLSFFVLFFAALYMFITFYVCDTQTCKSFKIADEKAPPGTKPNVLTLLSQFYNDGIWPLPYIGSTVSTVFCLWFLALPINIKTFAIVFSTSFVVMYFVFSFFGHHYINPTINYVSQYIEDSCPNISTLNPDGIEQEGEDLEPVSFATPVNVF